MPPTREPSQPIAQLLLEWQSTGDERKLEQLFGMIAPLAELTARHLLQAAGIADPDAVDDVMSKVFDHLRRLPGPRREERSVATFRSAVGDDEMRRDRSLGDGSGRGDAGLAFVRWLARKRARDIARATIRRSRRTRVFSQLDAADAEIVRRIGSCDPPHDEPRVEDVRLAIGSLDGRPRLVVELLLEGVSQAEIARRMGVCEGTVSRIRASAIETMRSAIGAPPFQGTVLRSPK